MSQQYELMVPIKGGQGGCLCCGYQHEVLPMDAIIAVGFGMAQLTCNGDVIYDEHDCNDEDEIITVADAESMAAKTPVADWRIHLVAPLSERHYQRQGDQHWVLYKKGTGFA